jgi:hypothetical protein
LDAASRVFAGSKYGPRHVLESAEIFEAYIKDGND